MVRARQARAVDLDKLEGRQLVRSNAAAQALHDLQRRRRFAGAGDPRHVQALALVLVICGSEKMALQGLRLANKGLSH